MKLAKANVFLVIVLSGLFARSVSAAALTPVLQYNFNTPGSTQTSSGPDTVSLTTYSGVTTNPTDLVTGSAIGPSGQSSDLSLNLGDAASENIADNQSSISTDTKLNTLSAFTLTAWVYNTVSLGKAEILFVLGNSGNGITFGLNSNSTQTPNAEYLKVGGSQVIASSTIAGVANQWTFIAVTCDSSGNVTYYVGSKMPGSVVTNGSGSAHSSVPTTNTFLGIGNSNLDANSQFPSDVDDLYLESGAATLSQVNMIHDMDLPEPGSASIFGISLIAAAARWRPLRGRYVAIGHR